VKKRKLSFFMERKNALCIRRIYDFCNDNKRLHYIRNIDRT